MPTMAHSKDLIRNKYMAKENILSDISEVESEQLDVEDSPRKDGRARSSTRGYESPVLDKIKAHESGKLARRSSGPK